MGLRDRLRGVLGIDEPPVRIALAFGIGVFWGISPLLGLHTVLGLLTAYALRLNKLVTLSGVYITNPWTIVPIYTFCAWVGAKIFGIQKLLPDVKWKHIKISAIKKDLAHLFWPFIVGSTLVAVLAGLLSFLIIWWAVSRDRKRRAGF